MIEEERNDIMAITKTILSDDFYDEELVNQASTCLMCGNEKVANGGTWGGTTASFLLTVCDDEHCIEKMIHWIIDAFISDGTKDINSLQTKQEFMNFVEKVYIKKLNHPNNKK